MKLSAADHQALRSAGFTATGLVFGNHVRLVTFSELVCRNQALPAQPFEQALTSAVWQALGKLKNMIGDADGVIGIRVNEESLSIRAVEVSVTGVAVRASGAVRPRQPFLSDLNGRDFVKLLHGGWVPCGLALGIAAVAVHGYERLGWSGAPKRELVLRSELLDSVQRRARELLVEDCARLGGEGVLLGQMAMRKQEPECERPPWDQRVDLSATELSPADLMSPELDLYVQAVFTGTAITRFRTPRSAPQHAPLTIMPLNRGGSG